MHVCMYRCGGLFPSSSLSIHHYLNNILPSGYYKLLRGEKSGNSNCTYGKVAFIQHYTKTKISIDPTIQVATRRYDIQNLRVIPTSCSDLLPSPNASPMAGVSLRTPPTRPDTSLRRRLCPSGSVPVASPQRAAGSCDAHRRRSPVLSHPSAALIIQIPHGGINSSRPSRSQL